MISSFFFFYIVVDPNNNDDADVEMTTKAVLYIFKFKKNDKGYETE